MHSSGGRLRDRRAPGVAKADILIGDERLLLFFFLTGVDQARMRDPELAGGPLASSADLCGGTWGDKGILNRPAALPMIAGLYKPLESA